MYNHFFSPIVEKFFIVTTSFQLLQPLLLLTLMHIFWECVPISLECMTKK